MKNETKEVLDIIQPFDLDEALFEFMKDPQTHLKNSKFMRRFDTSQEFSTSIINVQMEFVVPR